MARLPDFARYTSIVDVVDDLAAQKAQTVIYVVEREHGVETWTGTDLIRRSRLAAFRLHAAGVRAGDRVLTLAHNSAELGAAYLGIWRLRAVPVPLDHRFTPQVMARIAANADGTTIVTDDLQSVASLEGVAALSMADLVAVATDELPPDWSHELDTLERPVADDLYAILYTSGTTGQPRGVMQTHGTYVRAWAALLGNRTSRAWMQWFMPEDGRVLSIMPMSHTMGFTENLTSIIMGSVLVFPNMPSPRGLLDVMSRQRPTSIGVAPRFMELLWSQLRHEIAQQPGRLEEFDVRRARAAKWPYWVRRRMFKSERALLGGRLRMFGAGAAALAPEVQRAWESIGIPVLQGYGATESGSIAATSFFRHPAGKVGKPNRSQKVELADDGEVLVSGPMVAAGYWRDSEATSAAFDAAGRYHTGDIGRIDQKGELILTGRKKNVIVLSNGLKVHPEDIEASLYAAGLGETVVLETTPGRIEAVILDPDRETATVTAVGALGSEGQTLAAWVGGAIRTANAGLTAHERVDGWRLWPEADFPRTHTMKIQRDPVRDWATGLSSQAVTAPGQVLPSPDVRPAEA